ncbi:MAG: thiamine pyrophosphate-binding protein [Desulfuromonadaceae bacterium]
MSMALSNPNSHTQPDAGSAQQLGDLLINYLKLLDIDYVFGVPGGAIEPLYNALARNLSRGGPRPVVARHESGAAFMADGYARETGKLGVCCATTGPGTTNLITGVASAYVDRVPLLVITAQTALPIFGKLGLQDSSCTAVDTVGMFRHCTCYNTLISHRGQLESKLVAAIMAAHRNSAPAHISIPNDILRSPRRLRGGTDLLLSSLETLVPPKSLVHLDSLEKLRQELEHARKVVILVGNNCADAIDEILTLAETIQATIIASPQGKGAINPHHPLYRGVYGFAGHESARQVLFDDEVELVLAVNSRLDEMVLCGGEEGQLLNKKLIHIDVDPEHFTRSPMARVHVYGHPRVVFESLNWKLHPVHGKPAPAAGNSIPPLFGLPAGVQILDPESCQAEDSPLKPQRVMYELATRFPKETRFLIDAGNSWSWATHYLHPHSAGKYRIGMGFGAMAWAIGAAVGTAFGCPGSPVICLTGDGSSLMSGQELTVAVAEKLPVIFAVLNDRALGMVKHGQRLGGGEPIAFELPPVDFCLMARAMGAQAFCIRSPQDFADLDVASICRHVGPTLLEIHIDPEEVPPMGSRMRALVGKRGERQRTNVWVKD